jgi:dihydrofolate reductase
MQAPARPDEDRRGGFEHGGWGVPYADQVASEIAGEGLRREGAFLLGRRTYEDFYQVWHGRSDNPFSPVFEARTKYVVSGSLREPLVWGNSVLLRADAPGGVPAAVAALKAASSHDMMILGSGELIRSLLPDNLIDRLTLLITPLVLGSGTRLFGEASPTIRYRLTSSRPTTTGVIVATYELVDRRA